MAQTQREDFLGELGYEKPFDESLVEVPAGWHGGEVMNTGGNIMCRIWRTWETGVRRNETEFEVIYDVSQGETVALQAYTWDEGYEGYIFDRVVETREADKKADAAQARVAVELMKSHDSMGRKVVE